MIFLFSISKKLWPVCTCKQTTTTSFMTHHHKWKSSIESNYLHDYPVICLVNFYPIFLPQHLGGNRSN